MLISKSLSHSLVILIFLVPLSPPEVWVDDDFDPSTPGWGVTHFDKIQDGIDAVAPLGTVHVYEGVYPENLEVNKSIELLGADKNGVIIDGGGSGTVVHVHGNAVDTVVSGFFIKNSGKEWPDSGVLVNFVDRVVIKDNILENNMTAVHLTNSSGHTVTANTISGSTSSGIGIYCFQASSHDNVIADNVLDDNNFIGIRIYGVGNYASRNNVVKGNTISGCLETGLSISGEDNFLVRNASITGNSVSSTHQWDGMSLERLREGTVSNNRAENNIEAGITIWKYSKDNVITGNITLNNKKEGIQLKSDTCSNNLVANNITMFNEVGLGFFEGTRKNTVENNLILDNLVIGINIVNIYETFFFRNFIQNCVKKFGIWTHYAEDCVFEGNYISNCFLGGIEFHYAVDVVVSRNVITNNEHGIIMRSSNIFSLIKENVIASNREYGIWNPGPYGDLNTLYHNSLVDNAAGNAYDVHSNTWDDGYPSGGNYWSDYTGQDLDGDGIGDVPYPIPGGSSEDRYPLMAPYGGGILWADGYTFSAGSGGTVDFTLFADEANASRGYVLLGGMSGTEPGFVLPGGQATMPINWDLFTTLVLNNLNTALFHNFLGSLDATGTAFAQLNMPALQPDMIGVTMCYAFTCNKPFDLVSNPIEVLIVE